MPDAVATTTPASVRGWRPNAANRVTETLLFQTLQVRHEGVDICSRQLAPLLGHRRLFGGLGLRGHLRRMRDPASKVGGGQLRADTVEGAGLAALAGDGVAHPALLGLVDLRAALDQVGVL